MTAVPQLVLVLRIRGVQPPLSIRVDGMVLIKQELSICINTLFVSALFSSFLSFLYPYTVIPRLTSNPANEFSANEDFFAVFRTRLTNVLVDALANIKQQT